MGNTFDGVTVTNNATGVTIGGLAATPGQAPGNLISGNLDNGVALFGGSGHVVLGNLIGTDASGTAAVANRSGILLSNTAGDVIGGVGAGSRNVISGNATDGVVISGAGSTGNRVVGNRIGTTANGLSALGNGNDGVQINDAADNTIGGAAPGAGNLISGNDGNGVAISGASATGNLVAGNFVGTDATGTLDLGNGQEGIILSAPGNTVGGASAGARNVLSGNAKNGISIVFAEATGNVVLGNYIGTDATGTIAIGNSAEGIGIGVGASGNTIGGTAPGTRNLISGNANFGVRLADTGTTANVILGNFIGTTFDGSGALGNLATGIEFDNVSGNTVGGATSSARNVISSNGGPGISVSEGSRNVVILGNLIGTNAAGTGPLGNGGNGIQVIENSFANTLGGTAAGAGNVVSGNGGNGLAILGAAPFGNLVVGNYVGTDLAGAAAIPNALDGILVSAAPNNTIGGAAAGAGNLVSGNTGSGVFVFATTGGVLVLGNFLGTDATGTAALGNGRDGLTLDGATSVTVRGNLASGNAGAGIAALNNDTANDSFGHLIVGNKVGTDLAGLAAIGNGFAGVTLSRGTSDVTIGGATIADRNVISGTPGPGSSCSTPGPTGTWSGETTSGSTPPGPPRSATRGAASS